MPSELLADSTPHWFWQIILLLTSWLHLHYHLPHAACNLILRVLRVIFVTLGALDIESRPPLTLNTTLKRLGLIDEFRVLPTCMKCRRMYPSTSAPDLKCSVCQIAIFRSIYGSGDDVEFPILESRPLKVIFVQLQVFFQQCAANVIFIPGRINHAREYSHSRGVEITTGKVNVLCSRAGLSLGQPSLLTAYTIQRNHHIIHLQNSSLT